MTAADQFIVTWNDSGREPRCPPDPRYPHGIEIRIGDQALPHCKVALPYPAKRCGQYLVRCRLCNLIVILTTAGRADDPRSAEIPCVITQGRDNPKNMH